MTTYLPKAEFVKARVKEQLANRALFAIVTVVLANNKGISYKIPRAEGVALAKRLEDGLKPQLFVVEYYGKLKVAPAIRVELSPTEELCSYPMQWVHADVTNNHYGSYVKHQQDCIAEIIDNG